MINTILNTRNEIAEGAWDTAHMSVLTSLYLDLYIHLLISHYLEHCLFPVITPSSPPSQKLDKKGNSRRSLIGRYEEARYGEVFTFSQRRESMTESPWGTERSEVVTLTGPSLVQHPLMDSCNTDVSSQPNCHST